MRDDQDLERFVAAQEPVYQQVLQELTAGSKRTHWMWFIFPQLRGLGRTQTAWHYGIESAAEAGEYLRHPILGPRLEECTQRVLAVEGRTPLEIFGSPDHLKFHSCLTLFAEAAPEEPAFTQALRKYFADQRDPATLELLKRQTD